MATISKVTKRVKNSIKHIGLVKNDPYLEPFEEAIRGRHEHAKWKMNELLQNGKQSLSEFANGYA